MTIETERLILRPFQEGDAEDVFEYLKEPAVNCFADVPIPRIITRLASIFVRNLE